MGAPPAPGDRLAPRGGQAGQPLLLSDPGIDLGEFRIRKMVQRILAEQGYKPARASDQPHAPAYSAAPGVRLTLWRKCDRQLPSRRIFPSRPRGFALA